MLVLKYDTKRNLYKVNVRYMSLEKNEEGESARKNLHYLSEQCTEDEINFMKENASLDGEHG